MGSTRSVHGENVIAKAVERYLPQSVREVSLPGSRIDVVGYDKKAKVFKVVECKKSRRDTGIAHGFSQVNVYRTNIEKAGFQFLDALSRKYHEKNLRIRFERWMEATDFASRFRVEFYVALPDRACKDIERLKEFKLQYEDIGVIRVRPDGVCRPYVRVKGKRDFDLTKARPTTIRLIIPVGSEI